MFKCTPKEQQMCSSKLKGLGFSPQTTSRCDTHEPPSATDIGQWEVGRRQEGFDENFLGRRQETRIQSLGQEDPLEQGMATHSSTLAWRIPWTEELGRLQCMGLQESAMT